MFWCEQLQINTSYQIWQHSIRSYRNLLPLSVPLRMGLKFFKFTLVMSNVFYFKTHFGLMQKAAHKQQDRQTWQRSIWHYKICYLNGFIQFISHTMPSMLPRFTLVMSNLLCFIPLKAFCLAWTVADIQLSNQIRQGGIRRYCSLYFLLYKMTLNSL